MLKRKRNNIISLSVADAVASADWQYNNKPRSSYQYASGFVVNVPIIIKIFEMKVSSYISEN